MMVYQETISSEMLEIADILYRNLGNEWYLAGGTALALQIGHRKSIDLDYFIDTEFNVQKLREQITELFSNFSITIDYEEPQTLWCTIRGVKVSFIYRKAELLMPVLDSSPFRLASLCDITVMKLLAICSREEYKDYFDLAYLSQAGDVRDWISWWNKIHPEQDIASWLLALSAVDTVPAVSLVVLNNEKQLPVASTIKSVVQELTVFLQRTN